MDIRKVDDGELDEIVARNCTVHLEKLDDKQWWMQIVDADGDEARIEIYDCQLVWHCQNRDAQLRIGADDAGHSEASYDSPFLNWYVAKARRVLGEVMMRLLS